MGAVRLAVTMAVIGVAAGACAAVAMMPAFAPFRERDRRSEQPAIVFDRGNEPSSGQAYADAGRQRTEADSSLAITPGPRDGTVVLELPRWANEAKDWVGVGERALGAWRSWSRPDVASEPNADATERYVRPTPRYGGPSEDRGYDAPAYRDGRPRAEPPAYRENDEAAYEAAQRARDAARDAREAEDHGEDW
jgi:hypothetical protein